jgi:hypothetical protein
VWTLRLALAWSVAAFVAGTSTARAGAPSSQPPPLASDAPIEFSTEPPEGKTHDEAAEDLTRPPPPRPRRQGLVLEQTLGVLGFGGQFRHVAPPAVWTRAQLGYEVLRWLMLYGEAELAFTDTGVSQDESHTRAFPIWGFGGGVRATVHATDRVAAYGQFEAGALQADVPHDALTILGYRNAEALKLSVAARVGVEWYQMDRHLALFVAVGGRDATGFAKTIGSSDFPIMWDAGAGLRYTF